MAGCRAREVPTVESTLICHPATPAPGVRSVTARVTRAKGVLEIVFALDGDLATLVVPASGLPRPGERLWEHTCFEAFVGLDGAPGYHELNVAPSGGWQVHAFARYRDGGPLAGATRAPEIAVERGDARLALRMRVDLAALSPAYVGAALRVALAAVVEHRSGARSCWALRHPAGPPDFHHADGFALGLDG